MKKVLFTILIILISFVKGNAQIIKLDDLLEISKLSVEEMKTELQNYWKLKLPIRTISEEGSETKHYVFVFNEGDKKQVIRKSGRLQYNESKTFWLTDFQFDDEELLNSIKKSLLDRSFNLEVNEKNRSVYNDGKRAIIIRSKYSDSDKTRVEFYEIRVIN